MWPFAQMSGLRFCFQFSVLICPSFCYLPRPEELSGFYFYVSLIFFPLSGKYVAIHALYMNFAQ